MFAPTGQVFASGMSPYCKYSTDENQAIFNAKYDVGRAYRAADLVVVGRVVGEDQGNLLLTVNRVIKGDSAVNQIALVGPRCFGTACTGLSIAWGTNFLLLLREESPGVFHKVDGDGNDACPNVFEVDDNEVVIGEARVEIDRLGNYFENNPDPIPYP